MEIRARPWTKVSPPRKVLAIRLQAMGDLVITLPYLQHLRKSLPAGSELDLLSRKEVDSIPKSILLFNKIYSVGGGRDQIKQLFHCLYLLPQLMSRGYDLIIDLQNNRISRMVRMSLMPKAWSTFDRFSPSAAGERTRLTIEAAGLGNCVADTKFRVNSMPFVIYMLCKQGWDSGKELILLNPAGAFESRNWPIDHFVAFAQLWLRVFPETQFLVLGTALIESKAIYLKNSLGKQLINLVNLTTPAQAFAIIQQLKLVLSEDSGLMHMAWVSGIPTLALFGSTSSVWSRPLGDQTSFLDSADLECGPCMKEKCKFGDTPCLSRYSAEEVFNKALTLVRQHRISRD